MTLPTQPAPYAAAGVLVIAMAIGVFILSWRRDTREAREIRRRALRPEPLTVIRRIHDETARGSRAR